MEIKLVAEQLEAWARKDGWWPITEKIGAQYSGDLLESLDISDAEEWSRRCRNNALFIKRVFRSVTPYYLRQAEELAPAVMAAIEAEHQRLIDEEQSIALVAAAANKECMEAVNAKLMNSPLAIQAKEVREALHSLVAMLPPNTIRLTIHEVAA